jgi:hypothetical protein
VETLPVIRRYLWPGSLSYHIATRCSVLFLGGRDNVGYCPETGSVTAHVSLSAAGPAADYFRWEPDGP